MPTDNMPDSDFSTPIVCQCDGAGSCPTWQRYVSKTGHAICQGGNPRSIRKYFGDPPAPSGPASPIAPARREDGSLDRSLPRPWEGAQKAKPWHHAYSVAIPHLDTPELLHAVVGLWNLQLVRPHIIVIDTGSLAKNARELDALERDYPNLETHRMRPRGWQATSQPVAVAMDLAFAVCQTPYLIGTHTDVFPLSRDLGGWLIGQCDSDTPLVGWQMSPRPGWPEPLWEHIPSHTCTAYHMPTARANGWRWNMLGAFERLGLEPHQPPRGFPDTEVMLGLLLKEQSTPWKCLGPESNEPYANEWYEHHRSTTVKHLYGRETGDQRAESLARGLHSARERIAAWQEENTPGLAAQAVSFAKAATRHVAAGCPQATPEQIAERKAVCATCPEFDSGRNKCKVCGCKLRKKIAWALEKCPREKW